MLHFLGSSWICLHTLRNKQSVAFWLRFNRICVEAESGFVDGLEEPLGESSQLLRSGLTFLLQSHVLLLQLVNLHQKSQFRAMIIDLIN